MVRMEIQIDLSMASQRLSKEVRGLELLMDRKYLQEIVDQTK